MVVLFCSNSFFNVALRDNSIASKSCGSSSCVVVVVSSFVISVVVIWSLWFTLFSYVLLLFMLFSVIFVT